MDKTVFRESSVEKLASPEQLDRLIKVTRPAGWMVLVGLLAIVAAVVVWGFLGSISVTVVGNGILMKSGGLLNIEHEAGGTIKEIMVKPGDQVHQGDVVARIEQIDIVNRINETRTQLAELEDNRNRVQTYSVQDMQLQRRYLEQQEKTIQAAIASDTEQERFLRGKVAAYRSLEKDGGISRQQVVEITGQYQAVQRSIEENRNNLRQVTMKRLDLAQSKDQESRTSASRIDEMRRTLSVLEAELVQKSEVVSPYTGRVIEIGASEGAIYQPGATLVSVEPAGRGVKNLEAVIFISSGGSSLKPGLEAHVSPADVKKEEYGYMIGRVTSISDYPVSSSGMMTVLGNEALVQALMQRGPVFKATIDLVPSSRTPSGKKWSSSRGPAFEIQSGTMCTADIIEERQRPISLLIPYVKKMLGV